MDPPDSNRMAEEEIDDPEPIQETEEVEAEESEDAGDSPPSKPQDPTADPKAVPKETEPKPDSKEVDPKPDRKEADPDPVNPPPTSTISVEMTTTSDLSSTSSSSSSSEEDEIAVEKVKRKVQAVWQCINAECSVCTKARLETADQYLLAFYGVEHDPKKKRKICADCRERGYDVRDRVVQRIVEKKPAVEEYVPIPKADTVLLDSDEELRTDSSSDSEVEVDLRGGAGKTKEEKLKDIIEKAFDKFGFHDQIDMATKHFETKVTGYQKDFDEIESRIKNTEKEVDDLRNMLYKDFRPTLKFVPPVDLNVLEQSVPVTVGRTGPQQHTAAVHESQLKAASIPPMGELERPRLSVGDKALGMRGNILNIWTPGIVTDIEESNGEVLYKLKFEVNASGKKSAPQSKQLSWKHVAYNFTAKVRLPVGTRVIGIYHDPTWQQNRGGYYSGIIAEPPKVMNKFRYLVFFDDGYASYIPHDGIRVVTHQSNPEVWEDVHINSREFIKKYLRQYPERPMVKLNVGQIVRTEWEGKWWITRVQEVDASLVKLMYDVDGRQESIYRGSTRLGPLFLEMQQRKLRRENQGQGFARRNAQVFQMNKQRRNTPYVEYTRNTDATGDSETSNQQAPVKRAVARKSTASKRVEHVEDMRPKVHWDSKGEILRADITPAEGQRFTKHQCGPKCMAKPVYQYKEEMLKKENPLLIPIILGWKRYLTKHKNLGRRIVFYSAPCGRRLRTLEEVLRYIRVTQAALEIDFFNFDWWVHAYNLFKIEREFISIPDISYGKEAVPISCVNSMDKNYPEYVEYSTERLPQQGVTINTDEEFLTCCDCTDDCQNKEKCACQQLTIQSTAATAENVVNNNAGYVFRRLHENVPTGIYECNKGCKCKKTCLNRVAQHPLRCRLQVFKTEKRGWGIRTLCDIPAGGFICIYVGNLYASEEANKIGRNFGDEYFAELDMIETVERNKEGYESDVEDDFGDEVEVLSEFDASSDETGSTEEEDNANIKVDLVDRNFIANVAVAPTDRHTRRKKKEQTATKSTAAAEDVVLDEDSQEKSSRKPKDFGAHSSGEDEEKKEKAISVRKYFGKDEDVYIMDAKQIGNIGRYLNHSCNPNCFVQNCFVDTHDLRYPWVAFFASTYIRAGQELCWDYNYIVDQVQGKEIYCACGQENCRGRLL